MRPLIVTCIVLCVGIMLAGCGKVVEQNEIALVFKTMGKRDIELAKKKGGQDVGDNFKVEMLSAVRAPIETPDIKILRFPKGVQSYKFTGRSSLESRANEELCVDAEGGKVCFDIVVHMYIDESFTDLKDRLVKFARAYQLRQYSNQTNVLSKFISGRFRQILRQPFVQFAADKRALDLVRNKTEINKYALKSLNDRFNELGLRFTMVSISSAIRVNRGQQERMNQIVIQDVKRKILKLKNEQLLPLTTEIAKIRLEGEVLAEQAINKAKADKIRMITEAEKKRRKMFIDLIGKKHYVDFETMMSLVKNLENGKTSLTIVPEGAKVIIGQQSPAAYLK